MKNFFIRRCLTYATRLSLAGFCLASYAYNCDQLSPWQNDQIYNGGDEATQNGIAYRANWWTQNQSPDSHSGPWQEWSSLGACDGDNGNQNPIANPNGPYQAELGESITFSSAGSSDADGQITEFFWNFGDGQTSNAANPTHQYAEAGLFNATLTVTDDQGALVSAATQVTITDGNGGGECNLPTYNAGNQYATDDRVSHQGRAYLCLVGGWCSSDQTWAYEPGKGLYWQHAWQDQGACGEGNNQSPIANANGPYTGTINSSIMFSSRGSSDPDGTIDQFRWNFGDGSESTLANPTHQYSSAGQYTATLTVTDNLGAENTTSTRVTIQSDDGPSTPLPHRLLIGYWHNFDNGSGYIPIAQVDDAWDFINVSFAENKPGGSEGEVAFSPFGESEAAFKSGVQSLQNKGKKVLISLGGANAHIQLNTAASRDNFVRTMGEIIATYGFDGMDIDLEGGSLFMNAGDTIANPQTPAIVNLIAATRSLKARFGDSFILTMAPETAYVQGGLDNFGGIWGAYLPLIHALRTDLTVLHVQHYNTGSLTGTDGNIYNAGTADFHVAMSDMLLTGFAAAGNANNYFPPLRQDQIAFGLPSGTQSASSGYTAPAVAQQALDCLIKGTNCGNYQPSQAYPHFRGLMTWSINWDVFRQREFSTPHRQYLNQNP